MKVIAPSGFIPIRTSTLVTQWGIPMDVFLIVDGKPLRYVASGTELDLDRFKRLKEFRHTKVFIKKDDEEKYRNFLEEVMNEAESNHKIPIEQRSQTMTGNAENAAQNISEKPQDDAVFKSSATTFDRLARFLNSSESAYVEVLKTHNKKESDFVSHGIQVAALSYAICENLGLFKVAEWRKFLVTGASIHDLGMEKLGLPLKAHEEYTPEEKKIWLQHTDVAYQTFNSRDFVDPIIVQIVSQHEEVPNGSGTPNKLVQRQMNPLSIAVSMANTFDHHLVKHDGEFAPAMQSFMMNELGRYELDWMTTLKTLINQIK